MRLTDASNSSPFGVVDGPVFTYLNLDQSGLRVLGITWTKKKLSLVLKLYYVLIVLGHTNAST